MSACPSCSKPVAPDFRLCPYCGAELSTPGAPREERKRVSVLFCDLVGFTGRAERMDPEDVRALLQPYHARVRGELERHGGTVEKFIGDAVVALFGAPVAHEDDPERAVRAALAIREAVTGEELQVRIGVTTGEALVALDARPESGEGMASGDVVNTAARLQSAAPVNGILVDETTFRATQDRVDYREAAPVEAKGKEAPVGVWEAHDARSRLGVDTVHASAAPLVGRERELALLLDAFARARAEREPQLVTLIGVPGIGKSRLVYELMQVAAADPEPIRWRQGRCLPYGDGVTFWALGEIVKSQAGIFETDEAERADEKLSAALAELSSDPGERAWLENHLRPLIGLGVDSAGADSRAQEAVTAWIRFVETLADELPLVLVVEDLHWADETLLDFVDELVERAADVALLVVATARPELLERRPSWGGGKANSLTLSLSALGDEETARLLGALLRSPVLPAETQQSVLARAGGNPLFAEQYARMLAEHPDGKLPVPESVQGIIAARLDALSPAEKALLHEAAVHGKVFWADAIAMVGPADGEGVAQTLRALERKEFLRRQRRSTVAGETEYAFRHALLRDVAYGQIPRGERAAKHRRAAEWLEGLARERDDHVELIADHYARALELTRASGGDDSELVSRTRTALRDAGARACSLNAFAAAVRYLDGALELWPAAAADRPALLALRAKALHFVADESAERALEEARDALLAAADESGAAELEAALVEVWWYRGDRDRAFRHLDRAQALVAAAEPSPAKAQVLSQVARYRAIAGGAEEAIAAAEEALAMAEALGEEPLRGRALIDLGLAFWASGDLDRALAIAERAVEATVTANSPDAARAYNNLAVILSGLRGVDAAREAEVEAGRIAERFGDAKFVRFGRGGEVVNRFLDGRWDEAVTLADEFVAECEAGSPHYLESTVRNIRALIRGWRGDEQAALDDLARARELAERVKDPQTLLGSRTAALGVNFMLGRTREARGVAVELLAGDPGHVARGGGAAFWLAASAGELGVEDEARDLFGRGPETPWVEAARAALAADWHVAAGVYEQQGMKAPEAYSRLRAAEVLLAAGRRAEADEHLGRALAFFRSVGATRYVREAQALASKAATA